METISLVSDEEDEIEEDSSSSSGEESGGGGPTVVLRPGAKGGAIGAGARQGAGGAAAAGAAQGEHHHHHQHASDGHREHVLAAEKVVFLLAGPPHSRQAAQPGLSSATFTQGQVPKEIWVEGARVVMCASEQELLGSWRQWLLQRDPDALACFQVRDSVGALVARAEAIKLPASHQGQAVGAVGAAAGGSTGSIGRPLGLGAAGSSGMGSGGSLPHPGVLHLSRLLQRYSQPTSIKSVVQYSPAWVKSQVRARCVLRPALCTSNLCIMDGMPVCSLVSTVAHGCSSPVALCGLACSRACRLTATRRRSRCRAWRAGWWWTC